jgi:hypothetical protein
MTSTSRTSAARSLAACLFLGMVGLANAATTTLPVGGDIMYFDVTKFSGGVPVQFSGGTSTLTFSKGPFYDPADAGTLGGFAVFLAATGTSVRPKGPETSFSQFPLDNGDGTSQQVPGAITSQIASLNLDPSSGKVSSVNLAGAFSLEAPFIKGTARGGVATVSNLRFDLDNKRVIANLDGVVAATGALPSKSFSLQDATLFTFGALSGPTVYPIQTWRTSDACNLFNNASNCEDNRLQLEKAGYTVDNQTFVGRVRVPLLNGTLGWGQTTGYYVNGELKLSGLALTPEAQGFLADSLGLGSIGLPVLKSAAPDVGSVTLQTHYLFGAVPEPETYALMGLGLCLMAVAARRQQGRAA